MIHELKTDPEAFGASFLGDKHYELRRDDRHFEEGDLLILRETELSGEQMAEGAPLLYTGRVLSRIVTHKLEGYGLQPEWVILSVRPI